MLVCCTMNVVASERITFRPTLIHDHGLHRVE
jgi:hypothetical protein